MTLRELRDRWKEANRPYVEKFKQVQQAVALNAPQKDRETLLDELTSIPFYPDKWLKYAKRGLHLPRRSDSIPAWTGSVVKVGDRYCFDQTRLIWRCGKDRELPEGSLPDYLTRFRSWHVGWTLLPPELDYFVLVSEDGENWAGFSTLVSAYVHQIAVGKVRATWRLYLPKRACGIFVWDDEGWLALIGEVIVPAVVCVDLPEPPSKASVWG